jgi:hypothetical protein
MAGLPQAGIQETGLTMAFTKKGGGAGFFFLKNKSNHETTMRREAADKAWEKRWSELVFRGIVVSQVL